MPDKANKVRKAATDWVQSEEDLWRNFAKQALGNAAAEVVMPPSPTTTRELQLEDGDSAALVGDQDDQVLAVGPLRGNHPPLMEKHLRDLQEISFTHPQAYDMGAFRFESMSPKTLVKKTAFGHAMDKHPEALMDIMEAEGDGPTSKVQDFRPNRTMKRQTRTSRVVRRSGVFNSMTHR